MTATQTLAAPRTLVEDADACLTRGEYRRADSLYRRALAMVEETLGKNDPNVALLLNSLGVLYKYMGRFAEAGRVYRRALRIIERAAGTEPPVGRGSPTPPRSPTEGLPMQRRGRNRRPSVPKVAWSGDHATTQTAIACALATLYHNLGGLEHARGRYAKGEPYARKSVALRIAALGADDPAVAADQAALAALLDGQGQYAEAEALYGRALTVFEREYGPEHYDVAITLNNLAAVHQARDNPALAEQLYRRALAIKEKLLGRKHPDTAMTVHNLAVLAHEQGRRAEAERLYQRALAIFRKTLDAGHPKLRQAERNYGRCATLHPA